MPVRILTGLGHLLAGLTDELWAGIDPDEPLFCDCRPSLPCVDCSLLAAADDSGVAPAA